MINNILLIIFPSQLFQKKYINKIFNNDDNNFIILWEHDYFFKEFLYHKMKLAFHRCTMKKYYDDLSSKYKKLYVENISNNHQKQIIDFIKNNKINQIVFFNPIEKKLINLIENNKLINYNIDYLLFPTPYFLNSTDFEKNNKIKEFLKTPRHDTFYKYQRTFYNILIKKTSNKITPIGDKWSFDTENRSPFEKSQSEPKLLKYTSSERNKYIKSAILYVNNNYKNHYGDCNEEDFIYPIDNQESIKWLKFFILNKLDNFGKYEDALSSEIKFGFHSLLSCINNIGLITSQDILKELENYKKNIASLEGFIRQVIGWREYCYYVYDFYYDKLTTSSIYNKNKNKIPEKFWKGETKIPIIDNIIKNVNKYAYSHHIERLMCIGNFLLLIGLHPDEIYIWFQTMYIDAYDVFMVPNVYGMLCYAKLDDKSYMMTRPYFSSSNYIIKMSNYKSSEIEINSKKYKWDEIYDALYYNHINNHSEIFSKIYATAMAAKRWNSFDNSKKKSF